MTLTCYCCNTGGGRDSPCKSRQGNQPPEKNILPPRLQGFSFVHESRALPLSYRRPQFLPCAAKRCNYLPYCRRGTLSPLLQTRYIISLTADKVYYLPYCTANSQEKLFLSVFEDVKVHATSLNHTDFEIDRTKI